MSFFSYSQDSPDFVAFGAAHLSVFIALIFSCFIVIVSRKVIRQKPNVDAGIRWSLVTVFVFLEVVYQIWIVVNGAWGAHFTLPFHLSSVTWITAVIMLLTSRQRWFEITFFAGVGSALLTLITPDIGNFGFPHFRFFHFFLTHGLVIVAVVYMLAIKKQPVYLSSVFVVWLYLNLYAAFVFVINWLIPYANYMYLMEKPAGPSPFDWFGPWPYYIFVLQGASLLLFLIMYGVYKLLSSFKRARPSRSP